MNIKQVNEIFKTKYPNGEIIQKGKFHTYHYRVAVNFDTTLEYSKSYTYNVQNYAELLTKFGFQIIYKEDIETIKKEINNLKEQVKLGYDLATYEFFKTKNFYTEHEINLKKLLIKQNKKLLNEAIVVNK